MLRRLQFVDFGLTCFRDPPGIIYCGVDYKSGLRQLQKYLNQRRSGIGAVIALEQTGKALVSAAGVTAYRLCCSCAQASKTRGEWTWHP